ncbi:c-type cytochrome [Pontibacter vulgaris]|uniref:c-type cytochrome n=1 Tax=Pontibacter vulgaris TaxID=2905679 RepID=UPI001FA714AC|nr:c-type cytochrome [Pontibacter vulgaris]
MLKKILKVTLKVVGLLVLAVALAYAYISINVSSRMNKVYAVNAATLDLPKDKTILGNGKRLYTIKGCADCHGADLGGKVVFDDPAVGRITSANLTSGKGGLPANYEVKDWVRALRHGIGQDSKPLLVMPSHDIYKLSDNDMAAIIAYCRSQKPVDRDLPDIEIRPVGKVLTALDKIPMLSAEMIDHNYKAPAEMLPEISPAYGEYLAVACTGCHHENLKGGESPVPGGKSVPDITASGAVGKWSESQFVNTLRTGVRPNGVKLSSEMPWQMTKGYNDTEIKALYAYLKSKK